MSPGGRIKHDEIRLAVIFEAFEPLLIELLSQSLTLAF